MTYRSYFNMTNETVKFRTWLLLQPTVGEDDFKWLKAFNIPIRIDRPEHTFETMSGSSHTVAGTPRYTIDTTTDKQRDMLILKYGNNVLLIQETTVLPNTINYNDS